MKCPLCGGNGAYLYSMDDIEPGKNLKVDLICDECGNTFFNTIATVRIDIVLKRGSMEFNEEYCAAVRKRLKGRKKK